MLREAPKFFKKLLNRISTWEGNAAVGACLGMLLHHPVFMSCLDADIFAVNIYCYRAARRRKSALSERQFAATYANYGMDENTKIIRRRDAGYRTGHRSFRGL